MNILPEASFASRWPSNLRMETKRTKRIPFLGGICVMHSYVSYFEIINITIRYLFIKIKFCLTFEKLKNQKHYNLKYHFINNLYNTKFNVYMHTYIYYISSLKYYIWIKYTIPWFFLILQIIVNFIHLNINEDFI